MESWVKKWRQRLHPLLDHPAALLETLQGESRAPKHPPARLDPQVEEAILSIRDEPPEGLRRTPGPKAIQYYLQRNDTLQALRLAGSHSTRTIYQVLVKYQRIVPRKQRVPDPIERPEPMTSWQMDCTDVAGLPFDPEGKRAHQGETLNIVDSGTSLLLAAFVRADFSVSSSGREFPDPWDTQQRPGRS